MNVSGFTAEELNDFRDVLDRAVAEAALEIPVELLTRRLFKAASAGERDKDRLLDIVLDRSPSLTPPRLPFDVRALSAAGRDRYL
jgi:hypothetical protein